MIRTHVNLTIQLIIIFSIFNCSDNNDGLENSPSLDENDWNAKVHDFSIENDAILNWEDAMPSDMIGFNDPLTIDIQQFFEQVDKPIVLSFSPFWSSIDVYKQENDIVLEYDDWSEFGLYYELVLDSSIVDEFLNTIREDREVALLAVINSIERVEKLESTSGEFGSYIESTTSRKLVGDCIGFIKGEIVTFPWSKD